MPLIFTAFVPVSPPVIPPVTAGADQLYNVPAGMIPLIISVGVRLNIIPLQVVEVMALIIASGFSVTVTVKTFP